MLKAKEQRRQEQQQQQPLPPPLQHSVEAGGDAVPGTDAEATEEAPGAVEETALGELSGTARKTHRARRPKTSERRREARARDREAVASAGSSEADAAAQVVAGARDGERAA